MPYCTQLDFTITGLPAELINFDIRGLTVENIELGTHGYMFGASIQQIEVTNQTTCKCPQAFNRMFGHPLMENAACGVTDTIYSSISTSYFNMGGIHVSKKGFQSNGLDSAISSCEYLIDDPILRVLMWTMAVFATGGNFTVIVYRVVWGRENLQRVHGIYPFHLAISDLLMGVYLFIIAQADTAYRGEYVLYDEEWRHGQLCHLAGFLSTLSSETSAILILLITVDRFLAIRFPFGQYMIEAKHAWISCGAVWSVGLIAASTPLIMSDWEVYTFNSICVGLPLNTDEYPGSSYTTGIFIGINSALFLLIAIGQASIYRAMWANSRRASLNADQAKRRYKRDLAVARRLSLVVITDFLCWFPICVMGLMAQSGLLLIPNSAYAWSALVVMPINSAINPLLYTLRNVICGVIGKFRKQSTSDIKPTP